MGPSGRRTAAGSATAAGMASMSSGRTARNGTAWRGDGAFAWSPDGRRLALVRSGDVAIIGVDGRGLTRVRLPGLETWALSWSPDGRRLILAALAQGGSQIWLVGIDGRGLRRLTSAGSNHLVGWTRLAPVLPPARPVAPTERVTGARALALRAPIADLAADGPRVAFIAGTTRTDCDHVAVWTPATKSVRRFGLPAPAARSGTARFSPSRSSVAATPTPTRNPTLRAPRAAGPATSSPRPSTG